MSESLEFWVVVPEEAQNLKVNPSMEFDVGLTGYTTVGSATISRSTVATRRGLYSAFVNVGTVSERGIRSTDTYEMSYGQTLTFSCDVLGNKGAIYRLQILNNSNNAVLATAQFVATGQWQRKSVSYYSDTYITTYVRITRYSGGTNFYTDGWLVKFGDDNLYFDGDSQGWLRGAIEFRWNGVAHNSSSWRSGSCRKGGRMIRIKDFAQIRRVTGLSLVNHDLASVELVQGGEMYQGARPQARIWSMELVFTADNELNLLKKVRTISAAFDPRSDEQPVLLLAQWVDETGEELSDLLEIPSVYVSGLSGAMTSPVWYQTTVSFKAHDGLLLKNCDSAKSLMTLKTFIGYSLIRRDRYGVWGPWGITSIGGMSEVRDIVVAPNGTVYACGTWSSLNGSSSMANIAMWTEANGWNPLGSGLNNSVYKLLLGSDGKLYVFGAFTSAGGNPNANRCAVWDGNSWSAIGNLIGANAQINDACWTDDGCLWVVGKFTTIGGISAARVAVWNGVAWSAVGSGASGGLNEVYAVVPNLSRTGVMIGGEFDTVGGLSIQALAEWDGTGWKSVGTAYLDGVYTLFNRGDGRVIVGGRFTISGCKNIAAWNGSGWEKLGGGVSGVVRRIARDEFGEILAGSFDLAYGGGTSASPRPIVLADGIARWMQTQFAAFEADLPDSCYAVCHNPLNGDLYLGFTGSGTVSVQASTSVTLNGYQRAYPTFRMFGPGKIWNITNLTTGKRIDFDALTIQTGEVIVLICGPNGLRMYSNWRGDMGKFLMPTSAHNFALEVGRNDILAYVYGNTGVTTALVMIWQDGYRAIEGSVW